ncbi:MAG: PBP1A family penicillin-binding protein [Gemmatimonadota bacterium]|nr:PBP1A family penicillin-binding protein [Gemmatimonadota bacterium]
MRLTAWKRNHPRAAIIVGAVATVVGGGTLLFAVEALVRADLDRASLESPTRIYARPVVLRSGASVDRSDLRSQLDRLGYREQTSGRVDVGAYRLGSWTWMIGRRSFRHYDQLYPGDVATIRLGWNGRITSIRTQDGTALSYLLLEPELIRTLHSGSTEDRVPVPLEDIPAHLIDAVLAIEDQRFFEHAGLDVRRIVGAAAANVRAMDIEQGASTLTQQLAKNLFLSPRRSGIRKLREMLMAVVLEWRHTKDDILAAYLNQVYLGQDGALAIHGVGRAAQYYFGKDVSELGLHETALLAGMIRGPNLYSPQRHPETATARRNLVLDRMQQQGFLSESDHRRAVSRALGLRRVPEPTPHGRYFTDLVAGQLRSDYGDDILDRGLAVFTSLDTRLQEIAEAAVHNGLERLEHRYARLSAVGQPLQAALVALDPRTGEVLALVGGRDYRTSQFNRAVLGQRQPGSAFKPIVALSALARNADGDDPAFTLASLLNDAPLSLETPAGTWQPVNYDGRYRGQLTLREALERSLNVPFARLGMAVGPDRIVAVGRALGIESRLQPYPSLALGAFEVTPLELTRAFGVFASQGHLAPTITTLSVIDRSGEIVHQAELDRQQVVSAAEAYLVTSALRGAVERGTGRGLRSHGLSGPVAAKSGTTNDYRDAWFVGYTPDLAVGVWVGFDDGRSVGLSGASAALPIFARFMADALGPAGGEEFPMPYGVEMVEVDPTTGLLAGPGCWGAREVFLRGTAPERSCSPYWTSQRSRSDSRVYGELRRFWSELKRIWERERGGREE